MELEALIWFQEAEEAGVFMDWDSLVQALHVRFGQLLMMVLWKC